MNVRLAQQPLSVQRVFTARHDGTRLDQPLRLGQLRQHQLPKLLSNPAVLHHTGRLLAAPQPVKGLKQGAVEVVEMFEREKGLAVVFADVVEVGAGVSAAQERQSHVRYVDAHDGEGVPKLGVLAFQ